VCNKSELVSESVVVVQAVSACVSQCVIGVEVIHGTRGAKTLSVVQAVCAVSAASVRGVSSWR
jgi:hypothetical protein